ncbi:hypothetical protein ACULTK_002857 [Yersinia enterocolitica]|nr:hypothetical protein [Yersinia enterocolitica]
MKELSALLLAKQVKPSGEKTILSLLRGMTGSIFHTHMFPKGAVTLFVSDLFGVQHWRKKLGRCLSIFPVTNSVFASPYRSTFAFPYFCLILLLLIVMLLLHVLQAVTDETLD